MRKLRQTVGRVPVAQRTKANSVPSVAKQNQLGYRNTNVTNAVGSRRRKLAHQSSARNVATRLMMAT